MKFIKSTVAYLKMRAFFRLLIAFLAVIPIQTFCQNTDSIKTKAEMVFFDFNASELNPEALYKLDQLSSFIKQIELNKILITGHTDFIGGENYNAKLSKSRAASVAEFFHGKGINNEFIALFFSGKSRPIESNGTEAGRQKNRRAEIVIQYRQLPETMVINSDEPDTTITIEPDKHTIYGKQGTMVVIPEDFFAPYALSDINFTIKEAFTPCQIISQGLTTMDNNGGCLQTGGMVFFDVTYNFNKVNPSGDKKLEVWIPTNNPDEKMEVYIPESGAWKSYQAELELRQKDGKYYYVFETDLIGGFNIDKLIGPCPKNGPLVKTRMGKNQQVFLNYGDSTITEGSPVDKKTYQMPDFQSNLSPKLVAIAVSGNYVYIANKETGKIKYKSKKNKYILRARDYTKLDKFPDSESLTDYLCGM